MTPAAVSLDELCINAIRGLSIDAVQKANSGHPGLPLGAAPMAYAIWKRHLRHAPTQPQWLNRDRFILSAGHGSALLYSLLHLTGYDLPLSEVQAFRQIGSKTPGHPENHLTPGVEMATGPLGQGIATSVGFALAERYLAARFNRPEFSLFDHFTYVICSDGDLMEGVGQEAASLAGTLGLGKLIWVYDSNGITIDGSTDIAYREDVAAKFSALGWHVQSVDGMDVDAVDRALQSAKAETARPSIIIATTIIGFGSPNKAGTSKVHGAPLGEEELRLTKEALGLPSEPFSIPDDARAALDARAAGEAHVEAWNSLLSRYRTSFPELAAELDQALSGTWDCTSVAWPEFKSVATRKSSHDCVLALANHFPTLIGGSADLAESVYTDLHGMGLQSADDPNGRNIAFGIREHAMAAAVNGITLHGGCRAFGGTFLIFSDYCKPSIRLAALMEIPSIFVFSHDSIGLGEDGPTHQPVEQILGLRSIPNLNVIRPADGAETAVAWSLALESEDRPTAIVTSRQNLLVVTHEAPAEHPARNGGYVLQDSDGVPDLILIATGSEVSLALQAAEVLEGVNSRVVSMPCTRIFDEQPEAYRNSVLIPGIPTISIEAATTLGWQKYSDVQIGIDTFGASGPGPKLMEHFGFTVANVVETARNLLG